MKFGLIPYVMSFMAIFITFFSGEPSYASDNETANLSAKVSLPEQSKNSDWLEKGLYLSRYIEANRLVVNDQAAARFQTKVDEATGPEKLDLLYYQVLEATFYVYEDLLKTSKPQYIVEIEKQNSDEHRKYLETLNIFSKFYIGGNSTDSIKRLKLIAENDNLNIKARVRAYMMAGYAHGVMRDTEEIIDVLKQVKALLGVAELDPYFETELLEFEGFVHMISHDYAKAMNLMNERVLKARDLELLISGDSYVYHIARIMMTNGETSGLYEINDINHRVAEMTGKARSVFNAAYLCGVNYLRLSTHEKALECLLHAEKNLASAPDRAVHLDYYFILAYARMGQAKEARFHYERMSAHPLFAGLQTIQKDLPVAQAELHAVEGRPLQAFALQRDYTNQLLINHANELGDVANTLREYAEEQSKIQYDRSTLMKLNSSLKDEVITKQRIVSYASIGIAIIALLICLGLAMLARKLKRARIDADIANKSKSEFLAKMSHEIRTPMNGILGMTEVLLNSKLTKKQRSYANTVYKSGASLMGILNDILDFSKIEAGKMELDPTPFDLEVAVTDVITLMEQTARDKNLACKTEYQLGLPKKFMGDEGRIRQVLTNLISNAIKFTEAGYVAIKVEGRQRLNSETAQLKITIEDTGIGITDAQAEKIFDGFTQAEGSTTRRYGGTGLGLTISRQLVHAMSGNIGVESEMGKGSQFWIELELPIIRQSLQSKSETENEINEKPQNIKTKNYPTLAEESKSVASTEITEVKKKVKVLIVDSSESSLKRLRKLCLTYDMDVMCQKNAQTTLSTLRNAYESGMAFDVVILDYHISKSGGAATSGATIAKSIYQDNSVGDLTVILMSKIDITHYASRLRGIGVASVLVKPINPTQIMEVIDATTRKVNPLKQPFEAPPRLSRSTENAERFDIKSSTSKPLDPQNDASDPSALKNHGMCSVLIVDDNRTNRVVLSSFVDTDLYDVETAEDGKEAWKMSKKTRYDMIFMDISMPVMDGVKATMLIRDDESNPNYETPIIACTAHALKGDRSRFTSVGMNDYISKPIQKAALDKIMNKWIRAQNQAA